jgi:hypothetical protein
MIVLSVGFEVDVDVESQAKRRQACWMSQGVVMMK